MKRQLILAIPIALLLVACGSKNSARTEKTTSHKTTSSIDLSKSQQNETIASAIRERLLKQSQESQQSNNTETEEAKQKETIQSNVNTTAKFNGTYYSVQGKYDEIIIVNKKHPLDSEYDPGENRNAVKEVKRLISDMKKAKFKISKHYSGYRSYKEQKKLYRSYVKREGQKAADTYSAIPGYSEHQTGLTFDILDDTGNLLKEPNAAKWLAENAHRYGFVVRYLPGKEHITGYIAEPWHIRYVGPEASYIYKSGKTLEEYYDVPGGDYEK